MEEAMSHTGIHQYIFFFCFFSPSFSGFFFNTCMGCTLHSFPLIHPSVELLALYPWLACSGQANASNLMIFFPPPRLPPSHQSSFTLLSPVCPSSVCSLSHRQSHPAGVNGVLRS